MARERALRFEAREDAEGVDRLGDAAAEREVDLPELQHLHAVDQPEVPRRARAIGEPRAAAFVFGEAVLGREVLARERG